MPNIEVFSTTLDSTKPFSAPLALTSRPFTSGEWTLSFREAPCPCAPTMVCVPVVATLVLTWTGCTEQIEVAGGEIGFERGMSRGGEGSGIVGGSTARPVKRDKAFTKIAKGKFPPDESGSIKVANFVHSGRDKMVAVAFDLDVARSAEQTSLSRTLELLDGSARIDVCLLFPRERHRRLYASSKTLSEVSPYWRTQLSTRSFREGIDNDAVEPFVELDSDNEDSNLELDEEDRPIERQVEKDSSDVRTIAIYGTAYATYRAFFAWLYTSNVSFAPLSSTLSVPARPGSSSSSNSSPDSTVVDQRAARRRLSALSTALDPCLPKPVSPKSLYSLSHFLSIPSLSRTCLKAYLASLSPLNLVEELFSPFVDDHDDVRNAIVDWVTSTEEGRKAWDIARVGDGMRRWKERVKEEGTSVGELETLMRLCGI
ncbi:hypothetical protein JCM10212_002694 [Sporobolomyces blumeae]